MFKTQSTAVVAIHRDKGGWALLLVATRTQDGKRAMTPLIIACEDSDLFATCPHSEIWARCGYIKLLRTRPLRPEQHEEMLTHMIEDTYSAIAAEFRILEHAEVGVLSGWRNMNYFQALDNFVIGAEPAFRWLLNVVKNNKAWDTLRLCRALAEKYKMHESTHEEKAAAAERRLINQRGWR
jgi:hypothetical protein